jgi:hypothetical protein
MSEAAPLLLPELAMTANAAAGHARFRPDLAAHGVFAR